MKTSHKWFILNSGGGAVQAFDSPLQLSAKSNTEIRAYVAKIKGATSYTFEYDTDSGFSSPTVAQATSSNICIITGLTINTLYYIRVKPSNADYVTGSQRTIPFAVEGWYEIAGIEPDTNNEYGDASGGDTVYYVQSLKSIVNTSGPSISLGTASVLIAVNFRSGNPNTPAGDSASYILTGDSVERSLSRSITLTGNFCWYIESIHPGALRNILADAASGSYFAFNLTNQIRVYIDGTNYSYTHGSALNDGQHRKWGVRRTGSLLEISLDGGESWNTISSSAKTNPFVISKLGATAFGALYADTVGRMVFVNEALSDANFTYIRNYLKSNSFVSTDKAITEFEGITFGAAPSGNAIVGDSNLAKESGMTRRTWMILNFGDYTAMCHHTNANVPDYYQDTIYVLKHSTGQIGTLELPASINENHLYGGGFKFDGRYVHMEPNAWYDSTNNTERPNYPIMRMFAKNGSKVDLSEFESMPRFNGLFDGISDHQGYFGFFDTPNRRFLFSNGYQNSQEHLQVQYSDDYINSWLYNRILDSGDYTRWPYVFYIYHSHDTSEIIIGVNNYDTSLSKFTYAGLIRLSLDGKTVKNFSGSFTKDVSRHRWLTWSEFTTNFVFETRTSGEVRIGNAHIDENGELFLIVGDGGTDAQFKFCYGSPDGSLTEKSIDLGGRTMVTSGSAEGGYVHKISENMYDVYLLADNSGNHQVWKFRTSDKGDTWLDEGAVSADNTKRHAFIMGTANQTESDNITLSYLRVDSEGGGVSNGVAAYVFEDITP